MDEKLKQIQYFFPNFPHTENVLENIHDYITFLGMVHDSSNLSSWAMFLDCIDEAFEFYEDSKKVDVIFRILEVLYGYFDHDPDVNFKLALQLTRNDKYKESFPYARKAYLAYKNDPRVCNLYSSICNKLVSRWHFPMLNDRTRNTAYKRAITGAINKGVNSIIDIGAGTGLLSMYSKQAGCTEVYACEQNEFMCELARTILEQNNISVDTLPFNSLDLTVPELLPKRVSLAVTETFDCGLLGEGALVSLKHALEHLVLPNKHLSSEIANFKSIIPSHAEVFIAAVQSNYISKQTKCVDCCYLNGKSLILESDEPYMSENCRNLPGSYQLLSKWEPIININFNSVECLDDVIIGRKDIKMNLDINAVGNLDCIMLAFILHLDSEHHISTFPEERSCWENAFYPMHSSKQLQIGDTIPLNISFTDGITICVKDCLSPSLSTRSVSDSCMLKCINSQDYINYWKQAATDVWQMLEDKVPVKILDTCPFPVAGITAMSICGNAKLFTMDEENMKLFRFLGHAINLAEEGESFDVIFSWPLKKQEDSDVLTSWRKWLKSDGIIYPDTIEVNLFGIESPLLVNASLVDNGNTCGLDVGQVFNKFKTRVQYEINPEAWPHIILTSEMSFPTETDNQTGSSFQVASPPGDDGSHFLKTLRTLEKHTLNFTVSRTGELCGFFRTISLLNTKPINQKNIDTKLNSYEENNEQCLKKNYYNLSNIDGDSPVEVSCHFTDEILRVAEGEKFSMKVSISGSDMCLYDVEKL